MWLVIVLGDQYNPQKAAVVKPRNVVFENNLFLRAQNWPLNATIQDKNPVIVDSEFKNAGDVSIKDYVPSNEDIVKDKGIVTEPLLHDSIGIYIGLDVKQVHPKNAYLFD